MTLKIDNTEIERATSTKFLGVIIQENLSWSNHISTIITKINKNTGILRALQYKLPTGTLLTLYNTLIYPYLQYCNIAWGSQQSCHLTKLFICQKKALRVVCKAKWDAHTTPLFYTLGTLKLVDINRLQTGCFMHKAINNQLPPPFQDYFVLNTAVHNYFTRQSQKIHSTGLRTSARKFSIKSFGTFIWNSLPSSITSNLSPFSFKRTYKTYLLSSYNSG